MKKILLMTSVVLVVVLLRTGWLLYSRWNTGKIEQQVKQQKESNEARQVVERYGGNQLTILQLSMMPGVVSLGQTASLCYGVSNAKTVKIEPPVGEVWPSMSRCLEVRAKHDTTFKLIAEDGNGHTETATVALKVR